MRSPITRRQFLVDGGKVVAGTSFLGSWLAACGDTSGGTTQGALQYWALAYQPHGSNQTGKLTDAAVTAFINQHPGTKIAVTGYTGDQVGFTKLTQAVRSGQQADAFRLPSDDLALLAGQGLVAPIDDYLTEDDKSDIYPSLLDAIQINGKHYSWPLWVPPVGMYLNLDIFKERGVDPPKDNWTYDEFVDIAKRLTFTRANGQKVFGYTVAFDPGLINSWPFILGNGALPLSKDNKKYTFNSPEGISGLQKLVDLALKHKVTPPDFGTQSISDITTGFSQTKIFAMYSEPSGTSSAYKATRLNFDIRSMPIGGTGKPITTGGIGLIAVANISDQNKLKLAMELARYLTSTQVSKDVNGYYLAPGARKSVSVNDPISKFTPFVAYTYLPPTISQWPQIRSLLHPQIQNAVLGQTSPVQALNGPADEINSLLQG